MTTPGSGLIREVAITCMIRERQMRLYGHVARFPADDPAGRILSAREPAGRTRPLGQSI